MIDARLEQAWDWKDTPFHVDVTAVSPHGGVFHNDMLSTVVTRYRKDSDIVAMLNLAETALKDCAALRAKLLVCDLRPLGDASAGLACTAVVLHLIRTGVAPVLAILTRGPEAYIVSPEVEAALLKSKTSLQAFQSFEDVAQWSADRSEAMRTWLSARPDDFRASYSGSAYSIPELSASVLRSSGDIGDALLDSALLAYTREAHLAGGYDAFIFDSTASPPITDQQRYTDTYKNIILPFVSTGADRVWIHVRSGDAFMSKDAPPLEPLLKSFNIELYQVQTISESVRLLRSIRGLD